MKKPLGILFDMDGVIVDNHVYHYQSWQKLAEKYGVSIDEHFYRTQMNGRTLSGLMDVVFKDDLSKSEIQKRGEEKESLYRELYKPYLAPTKGLIAFLDTMKALDIPMVVGTSAPKENVVFTLDGLNIRHYFEDVLDDRAVSKGKPDPEIYQKCAQAIGKSPADCIVFEDAIAGIKAGMAAGCKVVALATSHKRDELDADMMLDDFENLNLEALQKLWKA